LAPISVSLYLFWKHQLLLALALHILPPVAASVLVISFADLAREQRSPVGRYVRRMMTRAVEAIRLAGDIITVLGAWYHSYTVIALGLVVIIGAWLSGKERDTLLR
jgi:hypothetical protein